MRKVLRVDLRHSNRSASHLFSIGRLPRAEYILEPPLLDTSFSDDDKLLLEQFAITDNPGLRSFQSQMVWALTSVCVSGHTSQLETPGE